MTKDNLARISDAITQMIRIDLDDDVLMSWIEYLSRAAISHRTDTAINADIAEAVVREHTPKG